MSNTMLEEDFEKVQACFSNYRDALLQLEKSLEKAKPRSKKEETAYKLLIDIIDSNGEKDYKTLNAIGIMLGK